MKPKNKKRITYSLLSALIVLVGAGTIAATNPDFALGRNIQILFNMFRELSLLYVDEIDPEKLMLNAADGMTRELDPYTELIPEKEMADFEIMTTGKYGGMGAIIQKKGDYVMVAQPYKGSPADKAGLQIGDIILAVDGKDVKGLEIQQVSSMLKGTPGTELRLKVRKLLTDQEQELTIKRERIVLSALPYWGIIADSIGYISHKEFTEDCSADLRNAFISMKKEGIKGLIIDLRGNGGGILQEAVKILSMFVPKGTEVVSMRGRMKELDATFTTQSEPIDTEIPVVVLINGSSASAAEIVAGAFQDLDRGVLVGQRSFGKGLVQNTRPVGFNSFLKLTTAKYYTPSGRCIQVLDYSHRAEDGSVGAVPDSLIREYSTAGGRKVYDGGGIMPDIRMPENYYSRFTNMLFAKGYIEDFANLYFKKHREPIDVDTFEVTDADYNEFVAFMADKPIDSESDTKQTLDQLRQRAERDKYLDRIEEELNAIEEKIQDDKQTDLEAFKDELKMLLSNEIVMRYHYIGGVVRNNAHHDPEVLKAIEVLRDTTNYHRILTSQDTERK